MYLKDTLLYLSQNQQMRNFVVHNKVARNVSRHFVAGERLDEAIETTKRLNQRGIQVALDHLGENVSSAEEAGEAAQDYIRAIRCINETHVDANISVKLTALGLDISRELCEQNLNTIFQTAQQSSAFVCIDMEGSDYTARTVEIAQRMHQRFEHIGTVIQAYLYRSTKDIEELIAQSVRIRLVKGAYKEPSSVAFQEKKDVDQQYVRLMQHLLARGNFPAIATHDETIINAACKYVRDHGIDRKAFEFQMLYGIRRDLQEKLVQQGYNMRVYVPYGSQWYPYLMRRMAERPANLIFVVSNSLR